MAEAATYDLIVVGMFLSTETFPLDRLSCSAMETKAELARTRKLE
jgi:hypothetical protein